MEIDKSLLAEIREYCRLNGIKDVKSQVNSCLRYGFNVLKFGDNPFRYHNPIEEENNATKNIVSNKNGDNQHGSVSQAVKADNDDKAKQGNQGETAKKKTRIKITRKSASTSEKENKDKPQG